MSFSEEYKIEEWLNLIKSVTFQIILPICPHTHITGSRLYLSPAITLNGCQLHNQILLITRSFIPKKPMQEKDENQIWAAVPSLVVYGAN